MRTSVRAKTNAAMLSCASAWPPSTSTWLRNYPQDALTRRQSAEQARGCQCSRGGRMADHIAAAQRYRARAAKCERSAKNTTSAGFGECYRLLARHYLVLANLEEDCAHRQSPFARPDDSKAEEQAPGRSVAGRMFAMRQLQMAAPSVETVSMPPMVVVAIPAAEFGP